ncbi:long-chain-fatty-acid--CoA ligase [Mycobacterium gallinarum]|uniref:Long-chain-fatty-acid--CoA ligase FadD13 n=1 Tax=Mycobacterium gallinarum TaxID=39689 RepID=A0A9W4BAX3_9MYCO|nr:AMP-binding protein [Mycobacterium gallinarum]BBY93378.1 long-chain-fatty-acid--CoA ligase [Mycobacterium gallinarum]
MTVLEDLLARVASQPNRPLLVYFDRVLTYGDVDRLSNAFAAGLADNGFRRGDRLALYLQNVPQYVVSLIAVWKLGGIAVALNPMLTPREVAKLLEDAAPAVLVTLDELDTPALREVVNMSSVRRVIRTSATAWRGPETDDLRAFIAEYDGQAPASISVDPHDVAVITYTSGTTGTPKGAMNTYRNVRTGGHAYRDWFALGPDDVVLGVAPLFHVTGLTGHIACSIAAGASLILSYRFTIDVTLDMIRRHRPTFTVGAITVFIALGNADVDPRDLASLTKVASGGAPVAAATAERFRDRFGTYIHNVYGMTETTAPVLAVPMGSAAPVEPETQALSVGVPMLSARVTVLDDDGRPLRAGQVGELAVAGPQIVPGYWRNEAATRSAVRDGWLLTGDVGYTDEDGWFYLIDRKKDMIVAGGYKVWPREVEDVLYTHDAVLEAGVVGVPDAYRGETVKAYVSLRDGHTVKPDELVAYCRERLAAYKCPRQVEIVDAIPKTTTGKILRRELRRTEG